MHINGGIYNHRGKNKLFNSAGTIGYIANIKGTYLISCIKSISRKIIDLNAKGKIESFLEDNIGDYLHDFEVGKDFLKKT